MQLQLSLRLAAIAAMVSEGNRLIDVGCDHGYLPVYLVLRKKIPSAIAADVRTGPLSRAQEHIRQFGLQEYIETRLSDGLRAIAPGEGDTLVIAGMGGPLMERILTEGAVVRNTLDELILQPQSDVPRFRHYIRSQGWEITEEDMVLEDGKYYPIMKARPVRALSPEQKTPWSETEECFGKYLLERRHPVLGQYLQREARIRGEILEKLANASKDAAKERIFEIKEEQRLILAALQRYEGI